jgi:hypothetical protein
MIIQFILALVITVLVFLAGQYPNHQKLYWFFIISCSASYIFTNIWKREMRKLNTLQERGEKPSPSLIVFGSTIELISGISNYLMIGALIWLLFVIAAGFFNKLFH